MNFELLKMKEESRTKAYDAKYHATELMLSLECYYWTADEFHYQEAIRQFESLAAKMAQFQNKHRKEGDND